MPQIAQQDYIRVFVPEGRSLENDANVLATLLKAAENGTIFDVILGFMTNGEPDCQFRVLAYKLLDRTITYYYDGENIDLSFSYSLTQYYGLAAVQAEVDRIDGLTDVFPTFIATNGFLSESNSGWPICTPEGYQYKVTLVEGKIATIEVSTTKVEGDYIAISIEDAQKLIGLPCTAMLPGE